MVEKNRLVRKILIVCIIGCSLCGAVVLGMRLFYHAFYYSAQKEFLIPELEEGFVPQGLTYCEEYDSYLISGYICGAENARICVVKDEEYRVVSLMDEKRNELISHSGAIAYSGNYVYLAGCDGMCYVFSLIELMEKQISSLQMLGSFETHNQASFCCVEDNRLFVGEYYHKFKYSTDESHHRITPTGDENHAVVTVFALDDVLPLGVSGRPEMALSITDRIQGMCFMERNAVMSASSVFQGSQLYVYDWEKAMSEQEDVMKIGVYDVPLYYLDAGTLLDCIEILPKSEGITVRDDKLYMIFESASERFRYGKLLGCEYAYSLPTEYFEISH
ncbi:MAG: hypothetical protein E7290_01900 [Lachnospiraceae bacterium]|nr:hypothetical protein [Lachnospiraceae bacterium]